MTNPTMMHVNVTRPSGSAAPAKLCPACGGLECLCRPRFYAGQLLTEVELNALDHYIVAKNKLHNRYLHGWGVVGGLEVRCDPCGSATVVVEPGYALSPCGEDIVVCRDTSVPICELIKACRPRDEPDCGPHVPAGEPCHEETETWILAIRYAESPAKRTRPFRVDSAAPCGCGSASAPKTGGCGCGCGGAKNGSAKNGGNGHASSSGCACRGTPAQTTRQPATSCRTTPECEPSVLCEEFHFEVYKATALDARQSRKLKGAMVDRFTCCVDEFIAALPPLPDLATASAQEKYDWWCGARLGLRNYLATHPYFDCGLNARVQQLALPDPQNDPNGFNNAAAAAFTDMFWIAVEIVFACLCSALQPPGAGAVTDPRIPLAAVTVHDDGNGCSVVGVCNWISERKLVATFPNLQYWLSWLPFGRGLRDALEGLCCGLVTPKRTVPSFAAAAAPGVSLGARPMSASFGASSRARFAEFAEMVAGAASRKQTIEPEALVAGLTGGKSTSREPMSGIERENPLPFLLLNTLGQPLLDQLRPAIFGAVTGIAARQPREADHEVAALTSELERLREQVRAQEAHVDELIARMRGHA